MLNFEGVQSRHGIGPDIYLTGNLPEPSSFYSTADMLYGRTVQILQDEKNLIIQMKHPLIRPSEVAPYAKQL